MTGDDQPDESDTRDETTVVGEVTVAVIEAAAVESELTRLGEDDADVVDDDGEQEEREDDPDEAMT